MEPILATDKQKISEWINNLEDKNLLDKITQLMNESNLSSEKSKEEKIAHWRKVGITGEELKKRLHKHIDGLPWKK